MRTRSRETELSSSTGHIEGSRKTTRAEEFSIDSIEPPKYFSEIPRTPYSSDTKSNNIISSSSAGIRTSENPESNYSESKSETNELSYSNEKSSRASTSGSVNSPFYSSSSDFQSPHTTSTETDNTYSNVKDPGGDSAYIKSTPVSNSSGSKNDCEPNNQSEITIDLKVQTEELDNRVNIVSNLNVNATTVNLIMQGDSDKMENDKITSFSKDAMISEPNKNSFYLKPKGDVQITPSHCRLIKYMISNIRAGSIYTKPFGEVPSIVPRYSAMPRTTSMEVNASSPDSTDKESDCASLVDSLDDPQSPRQSAMLPKLKYDDKPVRGDLSILLPDNSSSCRDGDTPITRPKLPKPAVFFIPMLSQDSLDKDKHKTVAERMPDRVRDRLERRKQIIDEKKVQLKPLDVIYRSALKDDNANQLLSINNQYRLKSENSNNSVYRRKHKVENKTKVPTTKPINKVSDINSNTFPLRKSKRCNKNIKRKFFSDENVETSSNMSHFRHSSTNIARSPSKIHEPFIEIKENSRNRRSEKKDIKKFEILEVTEETSSGQIYHHNLSRSKIPIPVNHKSNECDRFLANRTQYCPYSFIQSPDDDPKIDQLIANLLIDSLNTVGDEIPVDVSQTKNIEEKRPNYIISTKQNSNWYKQKFEIIPEERTLSSSTENISQGVSLSRSESDNKNSIKSVEVETQVELPEVTNEETKINKRILIDASSQTEVESSANDNLNDNELDRDSENNNAPLNKGKAALGKNQQDDASIPQGWITFYMLRKNPGSSSSTDEGITHNFT